MQGFCIMNALNPKEHPMHTAHTYILKPGQWKVKGNFYDANGRSMPITGNVGITHTDEQWINDSQMTLHTPGPLNFGNIYEIEPALPGVESTIWETEHNALGLIIGTLLIMEDCLIMSYTAEGGLYIGSETLLYVNDDTYRSFGVMWQGDQKISSWCADVNRVTAA